MSQVIQSLRNRARTLRHRIVLPETFDPRILSAAQEVTKHKIAEIVLVGKKDFLYKEAKNNNLDLSGIPYIDPSDPRNEELVTTFATDLFNRRRGKDFDKFESARNRIVSNCLYFGNCLVAEDYVHGQVGGSMSPTSDVVRAALHTIGTAPGIKTASSFMLMIKGEQEYVFSDCGFVIDPSADQLADIAYMASENAKKVLQIDPLVAMLSFSTKGSAHHAVVNKVIEAVKIINAREPNLKVDGELQFDAAFCPEVAARKAPKSNVAGKANVYIFPDLSSGNIGYKIASRLGHFEAIGPILQGFAKPTNDLSRGCEVEDIVDTIAITALQTGPEVKVRDIPNLDVL